MLRTTETFSSKNNFDMKKALLITVFCLASLSMRADEGMWMINLINSALEKKMQERGLELAAGEIYNADAPGTTISDAVVSLEFSCTGSMISENGLLITNHHCAYGDIYSLSTPEHNYLEEGFWAMTDDKEACIPGKQALFLKKVIDVTDEIAEIRDSLENTGIQFGNRKLFHIIETKYSNETGLEAIASSMWSDTKYYLALYQVYKDVRLVAAPPESIGDFGGETDNWEWPQHKGDFAIYRIYTAPDGSAAEYSPENVPLHPVKTLKISLDGYKPGDYSMIIGFPGHTSRYSNSAKIAYEQNLNMPIAAEVQGEILDIMDGWMNADPIVRLKYSNYYFGIGNVQELEEGRTRCFKRFGVQVRQEAVEKELQEWLDAAEDIPAGWKTVIPDLKAAYDAQEELQRNVHWYRETTIRGPRVAATAIRMHSKVKEADRTHIMRHYDNLDMRVERDIFRYCVEKFYTHIDSSYLGPFQKTLLEEFPARDGSMADFDAITARLWDNSFLSDTTRLRAVLEADCDGEDYYKDSLYRFFVDISIQDLNRQINEAQGEESINHLEKEYTRALYRMREDKGEVQYPDANSTMRLTYGQVGGVEPFDGVLCSYRTTAAGILEKYDPQDYEFCIDDRQKSLVEEGNWGKWAADPEENIMHINFLTDNDITGGNSGSPVLNSRGELIGLAFDGNKESLAGDVAYVNGYNKCVCVDIRYVLWILDRYAGMERIIDELHLN